MGITRTEDPLLALTRGGDAMSDHGTLRALGCMLVVIGMGGCMPLTPREDLPVPRVADPHAESTSNASMKGNTESQQSYASIEEMIQGRAPGVQVIRRSDGTYSLRIRGTSSPASSNEPLIVIDGSTAADQRAGRALAGINPNDVVRIDVLKDAASTAYYGMRGGNGVILVTTRQE
ncbi:MAG: TonB-dependent receptor plug domain-containing protein [Gemmatimonadaceae bacterium]